MVVWLVTLMSTSAKTVRRSTCRRWASKSMRLQKDRRDSKRERMVEGMLKREGRLQLLKLMKRSRKNLRRKSRSNRIKE